MEYEQPWNMGKILLEYIYIYMYITDINWNINDYEIVYSRDIKSKHVVITRYFKDILKRYTY